MVLLLETFPESNTKLLLFKTVSLRVTPIFMTEGQVVITGVCLDPVWWSGLWVTSE